MTAWLAWAKTAEGQASLTLAIVGVTTVVFYLLSKFQRGECDMRHVFTFVVNIIGLVASVFLFINAFAIIPISQQNAIWSGVAGIVLFIFTADNLHNQCREVFARPTTPEPNPSGKDVKLPPA